MCVCVCVCVCVAAHLGRASVTVCGGGLLALGGEPGVCVCVCVWLRTWGVPV